MTVCFWRILRAPSLAPLHLRSNTDDPAGRPQTWILAALLVGILASGVAAFGMRLARRDRNTTLCYGRGCAWAAC
jgi:hypothetical protein